MSKINAYLVVAMWGLGTTMTATPIYADGFNPINMINPGRWFDRNGNSYDSDDERPPPGYGVPYGAAPVVPGYWSHPGYARPRAPTAPSSPGYYAAPATQYRVPVARKSEGVSREEMARRIKQLEQRLEEMETRNRQSVPTPQPASPSTTSYRYYSGDQTPQSATQYPFRPLNTKR